MQHVALTVISILILLQQWLARLISIVMSSKALQRKIKMPIWRNSNTTSTMNLQGPFRQLQDLTIMFKYCFCAGRRLMATITKTWSRSGIFSKTPFTTRLKSTINGPALHILDTCCGGGAALSTSQEILAAGSYNTRTQRRRSSTQPPETQHRDQDPHSHFLRLLLPTMAGLGKTRRAFTAEELFRGLNTECGELDQALLHGQPWYIKATAYPSVTFTKLLPPPTTTLTEKLLFEVSMPKGAAKGVDFHRWVRSCDWPEYVNRVKMLGYAVDKEAYF